MRFSSVARWGAPGMKVSWQVTGVGHDAYAQANPLAVEVEKPANERGFYINPALMGNRKKNRSSGAGFRPRCGCSNRSVSRRAIWRQSRSREARSSAEFGGESFAKRTTPSAGVIWGTEEPRTVPAFSRGSAYRHMLLSARVLSLFTLLLAWPALALAKQLPTKVYTTADGLPHNWINRIVPDSRGFLWVCTNEGLARFDGYEFTTYGTDQGLPRSYVLDLIETRSGDYWAATSGGLCRFHPGPQSGPMFRPYRVTGDPKTEFARAILEDRTGVIWCGTTHGLYRLGPPDSARWIDLGMPGGNQYYRQVHALLEDRDGAIWTGSGSGLYRRGSDGSTRRYTTRDGLPDDDISALLADRQGEIWIGCATGLCRTVPHPRSEEHSTELQSPCNL